MPALCAITGLGLSALSRSHVGTTRDLAIDAIAAAIADAGLALADIDGLLITTSPSAPPGTLPLHLQNDLALGPLGLLAQVEGEGTSVIQAMQYAALALGAGMVRNVVCVFADARVQGAGSAAGYAKAMDLTGISGWEAEHGLLGAVGAYALAARRYLADTGQGEQDLAAWAIACRRWAQRNPQAFLRTPLDLDGYLASRCVAAPLRVLDCAYAVNGAAAVVLTTAQRAAVAPQPAVYVHGMGQGHAGDAGVRGAPAIASGAGLATRGALAMAGIGIADVAMLQLYDPFTSVGLQLLEACGFCAEGEAGAFVRSGATSPGGRLPVNTGGGHLSGFYLQGMTPVAEAVVQARGHGGERQAHRGPIFVGGVGGRMDYHAALVLDARERLA